MAKQPNEPWTGRPCAGTCGRVLRSRSYPADLAPEATAHFARGMCAGCDARAKRDAVATAPVADSKVLAHKSDLDAFLAARRRRGIPEAGVLATGTGIAA